MAAKKRKPTPPPPPVRKAPPRAKSPAGPTPRQAERAAAERTAAREARRRQLVAGGLVVAAVVAVGTYFVIDRRNDRQLEQALTSGSCEVDERADPTDGAPGNHVPNPAYAVEPPAGGNHLASNSPSGVYAGGRVPPDGQLMHSLEHGYVVVWHQPGLTAADKTALTELQQRRSPDVLLVERASLPVPVAATSWGQRLLCGQSEPDTIEQFVDAYVGNGPEDVRRT